jgi:hypothetical protein
MKKTTILFILIWVSSLLYAGDAVITNLSMLRYLKTDTNYSICGWVQNDSGSNILSFEIGWRLDNGTDNISPTINIGGIGLMPDGSYQVFTHPTPLYITTAGPHVIKVWVQATGDTVHSNDTIIYSFTALSTYVSKINLFEEYSGTWCSACPYGNSTTAKIAALPSAAVASFHCDDDYSFANGQAYYEAYYPGGLVITPGGMINMSESGAYAVNNNPQSWLDDMNARAGSVSPVSIAISPNLNSSTRQLNVTLTANFKYAESGNYYFNLYILEDGIVTSQAGVTGPYTLNHVVRTMLGGYSGTSGIIPASPVAGANYICTYSFTIPAEWNLWELELIGLVFRIDNGLSDALNTVKYSYEHTGIEEEASSNGFRIYPNPVSNYISCIVPEKSVIDISDAQGKTIKIIEDARTKITIDISDFSEGVYYITANSEKGMLRKKIIKE